MSNSQLVRFSRDGDQFHYLWAARRCLQLLSPVSGVVAITIEGPSLQELSGKGAIEEGEEKIDVAEYHGSQDLERATLVRYMQLKHSTARVADHWTPSELKETLIGFAKRYIAVREHPGLSPRVRLEFWFVSNRQIASDFAETIRDVADDKLARHPDDLTKLQSFTGLAGPELSAFCGLLRFDDKQDGYWDQRNFLAQEMNGYLVDADVDAPIQLKELVTRKATSEFAINPTITKVDVLRVLKTDERHLFPARCLIKRIEDAVPREQETDLIDKIVHAHHTPVIVHAAAGVGKSVFSSRIGRGLPAGSLSIVYDCFGNGQYRSATGYRHRHKDALVQVANELAGLGFCHPLIPTPHADSSDYLRAFLHRLNQAVIFLKSRIPGALLCIAIDAADNAQIAAEESGNSRSFARDLIRVRIPGEDEKDSGVNLKTIPG